MQKNLEKLIQQTVPFSSEIAKAEVGFLYLSYHLNSQRQQHFKKFGITTQQYNILRILRGQRGRPANINLLKERMLDKMSDASRLVERLIKNRLVYKKSNEIDKRNTDVFITNEGLDLLTKMDGFQEELPSAFDLLEPHELEKLNGLIDKILGGI